MELAHDDVGAGRVVVLLHGFPLDRTMWVEQVRALSPKFRLVVPDLRGHGNSPATSEHAYSMDLLAADVVELLDRLEIFEPVSLCGLSMGGYVAFSLVLNHASRFDRLVLMDTRASADSSETAQRRETNARELESTGSMRSIASTMEPKLFGETSRKVGLEAIERTTAVMMNTDPRGAAAALRGMAVRPDRRPILASIALPTLVVVGEEDMLTPPAEAQEIASGVPGARLELVSKAGHMAPLEQPAHVNSLLDRFIGISHKSAAM